MTTIEYPELGMTVILYGPDLADYIGWGYDEEEDDS